MWFNLCIISTVISGLSAVVMKKYTKDNNGRTLTMIGLLYYHIISLIISIIIYPECIKGFDIKNIFILMPLIITQSVGYFCAIMSIKYLDVSTSSAICKLKTVVPLIFGIVILNEQIKITQLIYAVILIILTIIINKIDNKKDNEVYNNKGVLYAYGFVILNGTAAFLNKVYVVKYTNPYIISFYFAIAIIIFLAIYCLITKRWNEIDIRKLKHKKYFVIHSFMDAISTIIDRFSLISGPVSIVYVITSSSILVTTLASKIILKEKISYKKYILIFGIFICILGLAFTK